MSLATTLTLIFNALQTGTGGLGTAENEVTPDYSDSLATGTGLDQADKLFSANYTIANGANQDIDLAGVLTDPFGATVTFARVKAIFIKLNTTTAGYYINVGGGDNGSGQNAFATIFADASDKLKVRAGGMGLLWAPDATAYAVTAGTGDILRINNPNAASVSVDVIIIGASA
jgi:hypothetical protein